MENYNQPEPANQLDNFFNLSFDSSAIAQLKQVALWAKICALCTFIGYGVALVVAIFGHTDYTLQAEGFSFGSYVRSSSSVSGVIVSIIIGGLINYFLYRFATAAARGVQSLDTQSLNTGLDSLRVYFKIYGIILIIILSLAALAMLIGIAAIGSMRR